MVLTPTDPLNAACCSSNLWDGEQCQARGSSYLYTYKTCDHMDSSGHGRTHRGAGGAREEARVGPLRAGGVQVRIRSSVKDHAGLVEEVALGFTSFG